MTRRIALLTSLLVLALAVPAAAQQSPFGPLPQAATPTPTATAAPTTDDGTTGRRTLFIIGGALLIGFAVMGWYITRDARRSIPEAELASGSRLREQGPHKHQKQAKAKARARTRRQKQARKAHRKR